MTLWEIVLTLVLLKIPVAYVGWVIWWAVKAEPEIGAEGGTDGVNWRPWRRPSPTASPTRSGRGGPDRMPGRAGTRPVRRPARLGTVGFGRAETMGSGTKGAGRA